jgi:hypothetical protein
VFALDRAPNEIVPRGGDDLVLANKYTADTDVVRAGGGFDRINVADGDKLDTANGARAGTVASWTPGGKRAPAARASTSNAHRADVLDRRWAGATKAPGHRFVVRPGRRTY